MSDADSRRRRRSPRIGERELELLAFTAEHRIVLGRHAERLLGISSAAASARLRSLAAGGLMRELSLFRRQPPGFQITGKGLHLIGSELSRPRLNVAEYRHDVGAAWLWLAARAGTFGPMREVIAERRLRSLDGARDAGRQPLAVRIGGSGPRGGERLHYPDLLLITPEGGRIALELELTGKGRARREQILAGYAADPRIDAVLYLAESPNIRRALAASAARLGISRLVHVQRVRGPAEGAVAGASRVADRAVRRDPPAVAL